MKKAGIYVNDLYCGVLTEDEEGISPTMPLTVQQYDKEMML